MKLAFPPEQIERAAAILERAQNDLGPDLCGGSVTDLLLDNMPELNSASQARALGLRAVLALPPKSTT